jgi:hypothetical protein
VNELDLWLKDLPTEFYAELDRLKGWRWKCRIDRVPTLKENAIKDIFHNRMPSWFFHEVVHTKRIRFLERRLEAVLALMRGSSNWVLFSRILERAFPRNVDTF